MSTRLDDYPVGHVYDIDYGEQFPFQIRLRFERKNEETTQTFLDNERLPEPLKPLVGLTHPITINTIRPGLFLATWQEPDKTTVAQVQDYENGVVYANVTQPDGTYVRVKGALKKVT
jgi:hypothetical protein